MTGKVLTCAEMRAADKYTIEELGVPSFALMERAGAELARMIERELIPLENKKILFVCGGGNNGGDGYCAARILLGKGYDVRIYPVFSPKSEDCVRQSDLCPAVRVDKSGLSKEYGLIADCIYGTGFHGALPEDAAHAVEFMAKSGAFVLSADIPSGLDGDNGLFSGTAVRADATAAIGEIKAGHLLNDGRDYCGRLEACDIGISLPEKNYAQIYGAERLSALFPKRRSRSNKGDFKRVSVIGGSENYSGAPLLSAGALRVGAGYLRLCVPDCIFGGLIGKFPEAILQKMPSENGILSFDRNVLNEVMRASDSIAVGMGCCKSRSVYEIVRYLLAEFAGTLVLDADALNSIAAYGTGFPKKKCSVILTPHVKEFSRLCGKSVDEVLKGGIALAKEFAFRHGVTLVLKSNTTVITDGTRVAVNIAGSPALAKGGSGDVLAGLIAALAARTDDKILACACAAYLLGESAVSAAETLGEYGVCAGDVLAKIPEKVKELETIAMR